MKRHVTIARREVVPVLDETTALLVQKKEVETKQQLLEAFTKHFVLSDDELEILTSTALGVNDEFFALLGRLKRIHADCQVLLGSNDQQLGLELMDRSSRHLNNAFQKLYRWIEKEFKTLDLENPRMNSSIRRALRVLAERPTLFQNCLDFFAEARERNLSDAFYSALTGAGAQSDDRTSKPMDYYAHDSLRFIGDMLAWTHSAAVSERESLEVLFISEGDEIARGIQAGRESEPWLQEDTPAFDGKKTLEELVNRDLAGVSRALRQRVEQSIKSDEDPVLAYKIANLVDFYRVTFARLLGSESSVLETLTTLQESAMFQYRTAMKDHINSLSTSAAEAPPDLSPPEFLIEALMQLKELMKSYDASFAPANSRETNFQPVLSESLDPFLEIAAKISTKLKEPATAIFTVNCLLASKVVLASFDFTTEKVSELEDTIDEYASKLIEYQHAFLVHTSGLHALLVALAPLTDSEADTRTIPSLSAFQPQALTDSSQILDDFLPSALMDATDNLKTLKNAQMVEDITAEAASRFCEDFEHVDSRLSAADALLQNEDGEGEEDRERVSLRELFPRTSGEIRVLLS